MLSKSLRLSTIIFAFMMIDMTSTAQSIFDQLSGKIDIIVDISGSGDFTTVQKAIDSIPDNNDVWKVIFVKKGIYYEKIVLDYKKTKVILVGEDVDSTIITYDDYADKVLPGHTFSTYTFRADAPDFQAYNISFESTAGNRGQGVAFHGNGDRQILYHCRLLGNQDTYFDNFRTRRYIRDCYIEGSVDYIFGFGVTLFDSCQLHTNQSGGYVTAASTPQYYEFGYVFKNCRLTTGLAVSGLSLGRPWFDWANTVFYECWEPEGLSSTGWTAWSGRENTCFYREYNCFGPGSDTTNRVSFGKQLDPARASRYIMDTIFAVSNFPTYLGYDGDTAELMKVYRRFETSGYPERAVILLKAGRDTFPEYPAENWTPVMDDEIYGVIKNNTFPMMDSINGKLIIENMLQNGNEVDGFDPEITAYGIELDKNDTTGPVISMVVQDAIVTVDYPTTLPGMAKVTVLSKDKTNGTIFSVYFSKDSAYWDADLKQVVVNSKDTILIEPGILEYNFRLRPGATKVSTVYVYVKISGQLYTKTIPTTVPGTIEIEVTAIDKVTKNNYVINVDLPTGAEDLEIQYPGRLSLMNPIHDKLLVFNQYDQPASPDITIYDLNGKMLYSISLTNLSKGVSEVNVDMSYLKAGIYLYCIKMEEDNIFGKMIKLEN